MSEFAGSSLIAVMVWAGKQISTHLLNAWKVFGVTEKEKTVCGSKCCGLDDTVVIGQRLDSISEVFSNLIDSVICCLMLLFLGLGAFSIHWTVLSIKGCFFFALVPPGCNIIE